MNDIDAMLVALAEPTRRRMVDLLRARPWRASDLAVAVKLTPPALSRHLRVLRRTGLIEEDRVERDARVRLYRVRHDRLEPLIAWLEMVRAAGASTSASAEASDHSVA